MNKKEIISVLHKENVLKDIGSGPTVIVVSNGKKNTTYASKTERKSYYSIYRKNIRAYVQNTN